MTRDPYRYYRVEARELLDGLGQGALDLESGAAGPEVVARLLRLAHTLKGASRVVKRAEMAALAHEIEEELAPHRESGAPPAARVREIRRRLGEMSALLADLDHAGAPHAAAQARDGEGAAPVLRVDIDDADSVLRTLSEQGAHHAVLRAELSALEQARRLAAVLADQLGPRSRGSGAP
ncbi:MAG TPA: Hpt domain-containing protein, partial [Anaeromyxobacter sp.]